MFHHPRTYALRTGLVIALVTTTVAAAGAAGFHRYLATQTGGSNGATNFLQTSDSASALQGNVGANDTSYTVPFGVLGVVNPASSTFGIGVLGLSTTGYGVAGEALGSEPSVLAYAGGTGIGLEATSTADSSPATYSEAKGNGAGVVARADGYGYGISAYSRTGNAVIGYTPGSGGVATLGAPTGEGVIAYGYSGNATNPALSATQGLTGTDLFGTFNTSGGETMIVQAASKNRSGHVAGGASDVQFSGDVYVYGRIYQDCSGYPVGASTSCYDVALGPYGTSSVSRTVNASGVRTYASQQTLPTMEDFGTAQLVGGRAYVRIDPAFAATMAHVPYLVFITPGGESRGVYVTEKSAQGFAVRENAGGRATMTFDYRIVATPLGTRPERLAVIPPKSPQALAAPDASFLARRAVIERQKAHPFDARVAAPIAPNAMVRPH